MFIDGEFIQGRYGGSQETTNNRMEMFGLIGGMEMLPTQQMIRCKGCGVVADPHEMTEFCEIKGTIMRPLYDNAAIVSDSQYCVRGASEWVHSWKRSGWKTSSKQPVKNQDLWERIDALARVCGARFEWVKGHSNDPGNTMADHFAVAGKKMVKKMGQAEWDMRISAEEVANFLA